MIYVLACCVGILFVSNANAAKLISLATAKVVNEKTDIVSNRSPENSGRNNFIEIPIDLSSVSTEKRDAILLGNEVASYSLTGTSNTVLNITFGPKETNEILDADGSKDVTIELKNQEGKVIKARLNASSGKITFDQDGHAKLLLKIEIPPGEKLNSQEVYKATYYIILQH